MICSKCGNHCDEGVAFCGTCGASFGSARRNPGTGGRPPGDSKNGGVIEVGPIKLDATNEDNSKITLGTTVIDAKLIFVAISGLLAFMFFMPLFRAPITMTPTFMVFFGRAGARMSFVAIFILLIPVLVGLLFWFKNQIQTQIAFVKNNLYIIAASGFFLSFIMLLITRSSVRSIYGPWGGVTFFFWLLVLGYLAIIAFTVLFVMSSKGVGFKLGSEPNRAGPPVQREPRYAGGQTAARKEEVSGVVMSTGDYIGKQRSGIVVILLSIITCGIYMFYWYYVTMEDINKIAGEERIPAAGWLIGSILCSPLIWVVYYKLDKNLARVSAENGTYYKENFVLWLLLTFFCGIGTFIAIFQICGGLNEIWNKRALESGRPLE